MELSIAEHSVVGSVSPTECADVLVMSPYVAGVVDGATAKPWDDACGPDGRQIAHAVAARLSALPLSATAEEASRSVTADVAAMLAAVDISPGAGSAAAFTVVHLGQRQLWRVGEANVLINGRPCEGATAGEEVVARARALVLHSLLAQGVSVAELRTSDPGRLAIQEVLRALVSVRNRDVAGYVNAAVDGRPIPPSFLQVVELPANECEVVITSDGYPEAAPTLAETEALLRLRLTDDPLLIAEPPATKGWMIGRESFDDRAYLRFFVPAGGPVGRC